MKVARGIALGFVCCLLAVTSDAAVRYVDAQNVSGTENGETWETAFTTIQAGITAANADDEVWVAAGSYPEIVTLKQGVAVYGGFAGPGAVFADRDPRVYETIIDCQNTQRGVIGANDARLDGFTILDAFSNDIGGGMLNDGTSPTVANCVFLECSNGGEAPSTTGPVRRRCLKTACSIRMLPAAQAAGQSITLVTKLRSGAACSAVMPPRFGAVRYSTPEEPHAAPSTHASL